MGLDIVELIMAVEEAFQVDLPDKELGWVSTVGDLHQLVLGKLRLKNLRRGPGETSSWNERDSWEALCRIIVEQSAIPRERITPQARIVEDLGIN